MDEHHDAEMTPQDATKVVAVAFLDHWREVLDRLVAGEDLASARADRFLAGSPAARLRIARRFYSVERARRLAGLSESEVCELLEPWLEIAVEYCLGEETEREDIRSFLRSCPTSEYMMVVEYFNRASLVDRYPGDAAGYDDLYERTAAGCSVGGIARVFKSTGEEFTPMERRSAVAGLKRAFSDGYADAGDDEPWTCSEYEAENHREVAVYIEEECQ